jgi:hypothetical protein
MLTTVSRAKSSMSIHRYRSGAQRETLLNLVNSSMVLPATNVGAVQGIGQRTQEVTGLGCLHLTQLSSIEK